MKFEKAIDRIDGLQKEQEAVYHFAAQRCGLSDTALWILYLLDTAELQMTQQILCRRCCFPKQTVHTALCNLEKQGILVRSRSNCHPRQIIVELTEQGKALAVQTAKPLRLAELRAYAALTERELASYVAIGEKINRALRVEFERSLEEKS